MLIRSQLFIIQIQRPRSSGVWNFYEINSIRSPNMALVTLKSVLHEAQKGKYAVGAFNFFTLENLRGIIKGAR
ncbi:MAG: class II fructose-bisphosphate aldolase, partial [Sphaerochaeta sp.]